uniref:Putative translation initiation inhibitor n=1 Tax=Moniliophthora roreri TaxID=221103 RepID=A0A0W0G8V4_MONRR
MSPPFARAYPEGRKLTSFISIAITVFGLAVIALPWLLSSSLLALEGRAHVVESLPSYHVNNNHLLIRPSGSQYRNAPVAIGPYSEAIAVGGFLFCSGCIPVDPSSGSVPDGMEAQTKQALKNSKAIIEAGDSELGKVFKTTVFVKDLSHFAMVDDVYGQVFTDYSSKPARSHAEVSRLPHDALIEIECIARCATVDARSQRQTLAFVSYSLK